MCLIALSRSRFAELTPSFWREACRTNPHGFGVMYHANHQLHVERVQTYDEQSLQQRLAGLPRGVQVAVHLREATYGAGGCLNMHPHLLRDDEGRVLAMMHNGSVPAMNADPHDGPSDSALLLQNWLGPRLGGSLQGWRDERLHEELDAFLPERNRLVFLDSEGHWKLLRQQEGFFAGETWLSNPKAKAWVEAAQPA